MRRLLLALVALALVPASAGAEGYTATSTTAGQTICPVIYGLSVVNNAAVHNHSGVYCQAGDKPVQGSPTGNLFVEVRSRIWVNGVGPADDTQWGGGLGWRQLGLDSSAGLCFCHYNGRSDVKIHIDNFNGGNILFAASGGTYSNPDGECTISADRTLKTCYFIDTDW